MSWAGFAAAEPELAAAVRDRFELRKHATLATVRTDGAPRISGTEVEFADGELWLGMMPGSRKAQDLLRDSRLALHSPTVDPPADNPSDWAGEAKISGRAVAASEATGSDDALRFRIEIAEAVLTQIGDPADHLRIQLWRPDHGVRAFRR